ncbi:hypothetical protein I3843_01G011800 [Carya illinoinensis]|uniref:Uncharacterized protein n=1 Tax=Carya illinoinensis TaxID=32201 RepID=A0A922K2S7_CARIL|nr:hypothetical protein I3842_01G011000 [Carya illinoinensis]KAG7993586.1 hypothetical protein I3843_01G011800 [Carya illinoinensis]
MKTFLHDGVEGSESVFGCECVLIQRGTIMDIHVAGRGGKGEGLSVSRAMVMCSAATVCMLFKGVTAGFMWLCFIHGKQRCFFGRHAGLHGSFKELSGVKPCDTHGGDPRGRWSEWG